MGGVARLPRGAGCRVPACALLLILFCSSAMLSHVEAKGGSKRNSRTSKRAKLLDRELQTRRASCDADTSKDEWEGVEDGYDRENAVLRCTSETCYETVYGDLWLEEGEVDAVRYKSFKVCARNELRGLASKDGANSTESGVLGGATPAESVDDYDEGEQDSDYADDDGLPGRASEAAANLLSETHVQRAMAAVAAAKLRPGFRNEL